jgi:phosphomannomutase
MTKTGKTPSELLDYLHSKVGFHYYQRIDVQFPEDEREEIINRIGENIPKSVCGVNVDRVDTADGFYISLVDSSWLLIRFSGTEPLLRIYAESDSQDRVERLLKLGKKLAGV